jgi:hypothetical protein
MPAGIIRAIYIFRRMKMKNTVKLIGFIALVAVIGFSMAACDDGNGDGDDGDGLFQTVSTYKGTASGRVYVLEITSYSDSDDVSFTLELASLYNCTGTAIKSGNNWLLTPYSGEGTFSITVSSSGITAITGMIAFDGGYTEPAPVSITPSGYSSEKNKVKRPQAVEQVNDNRLIGKWEVEKIIDYDDDENNLPYEGIDSCGFEFSKNSLEIYENGSMVESYSTWTRSDRIFGTGGGAWEYSITGDVLKITGEYSFSNGEGCNGFIARKVVGFGWE